MLRITYENSPQATVLKLEGRLAGLWVDEVARTWSDTIGEKPAKNVTVDLSSVTYIDAEGKKLLAWLYERGAKLTSGYLMTKYIVDQVVKEVSRHNNTQGENHALALRSGTGR